MGQDYCIYCMSSSTVDACPNCGKKRSDYITAPHHLSPGTVLNGKYEIGAVLGEGGFGITYIGKDINLNLRVAIKEYFPSGIVNRNTTASAEITAHFGNAQESFEKGKRSFLEEARTLAKFCDDPSIVSVRDFFSENNTAYIVMEYLEGIDLKDYLRQNGTMSFEQAFTMLSPIMSALSKVHEQGLIHRDISPANIMVTKSGSVKLLDFGAARNVGGADEKSLSILLKPGYAPEEQYRTRGNQGPWTDVYALSATLYKLVTGITPIDAMNRLFRDDLAEPSSVNSQVSPKQSAVILKGMAVQQEQRFQTISDLQNACQASIASDKPTDVPFVSEATITGEQYFAAETETTVAADSHIAAHPRPASDQKTQGPVRSAAPAAARPSIPTQTPREKALNHQQQGVQEQPGQQENKSVKDAKKPNTLCFILSIVTGLISLFFIVLFFASFLESTGANSTPAGAKPMFAVMSIAFAGITVLLGRTYYPRLNNAKRKPNVPCLVFSIIMTVVAVIWTFLTLATQDRAEEGSRGFIIAFGIVLLAVAAFFGYFYYPRIGRKKQVKAIKIHGGFIAAAVIGFVVYIVYLSLNTVSIGDQKIKRNATEVELSLDIVTNHEIEKLKELKKLETLRVYECFLDDRDVKIIGELTQLQRLELNANTDITDISPLNNLKNLTYLNISNTKVSDISCLTNLTALETLKINGTKIKDLNILGSYSHLKELEMNSLSELDESTISLPASLQTLYCNNDNLTSIAFASGSESLHNIYASGNGISDLSPLDKFENIFYIDFSNNNISDISPVCKKGIDELSFNNNQISDISALSGVKVTKLNLSGNQISDISALTDNSGIRYLDLSHNNITDISPLKDCFRIHSLDLSYNSIADISALATIDELTILNLRANQIKDISALAQIKSLIDAGFPLDLQDNKIENIQALSSFTNTDHITLSNNNISDITPLASCRALTYLTLNNNHISDVSALYSLPNLNMLEVVGNPITDFSAAFLNPSTGVFGEGTNLSYAVLRISYNEEIDWSALATAELRVFIYDVTGRQKAELQELGFTNFCASTDLDSSDRLGSEGNDG